jgi:hypothetical protein
MEPTLTLYYVGSWTALRSNHCRTCYTGNTARHYAAKSRSFITSPKSSMTLPSLRDGVRISQRVSLEDILQKRHRGLEKVALSRAVRRHIKSRVVRYRNETVD